MYFYLGILFVLASALITKSNHYCQHVRRPIINDKKSTIIDPNYRVY